MLIEFRDRDIHHDVRIALLPDGGHETTCRVRVWCGKGSTVVVEEHAGSKIEAIHAAAHTLKRSLHGRWLRQRSLLRGALS